MEEHVGTLIWIAIIVLSLLSGLNKKRRHTRNAQPQRTARPAEEEHSSMEEPEWEEALPPVPTVRPFAASQRSETPYRPLRRPDAAAKPKSERPRPAHAQEATVEAPVVENGIAQRFDLREAVIYAEILKPKYDEY